MWFFIYAEDIENSNELRAKARPAHLARLEQLKNEGRLLLAGPHPLFDAENNVKGMSGSTIIASFDNLEEAQKWASEDPYWTEGVFKQGTAIVKPMNITAKMENTSF